MENSRTFYTEMKNNGISKDFFNIVFLLLSQLCPVVESEGSLGSTQFPPV